MLKGVMGLATGPACRVADATVQLTRLGGQGVLVPGGFILTAAHCVDWTVKGNSMGILGDHFLESIETRSGAKFRVRPCAVEPVSDIAALGEPDNQELAEDCEAFETWRAKTKAIAVRPHLFAGRDLLRVRTKHPMPGGRPLGVVNEEIPVYTFTPKSQWLD